ncbi:MAG TPA: hypothetical protein VN767_00520 [Streptosporangiaceae bacterium]|jgi:hypothetical protein|nr:hypothetical protein [Streptosporangiaceae bacterium]
MEPRLPQIRYRYPWPHRPGSEAIIHSRTGPLCPFRGSGLALAHRIAAAGHPAGRIHHSCFGPDTGLMVYEVWETQQAFDDYGKTLMPILHKAGIDPGTPDVMPLHNLVV